VKSILYPLILQNKLGDGVMWDAKRSGRNEGLVRGQDPGDRVRAVFSEDVIDTEFIGSLSYIPF